MLGGITCQIGSSMLAVAPSSKARRKKLADKSIWRIPGASRFCTSTMASSVIRMAVRMHDNSSGVLTDLAALTTAAASTGAPFGNRTFAARDIAPVHSSTATTDLAGISSASVRAKWATPSSNSR